jgi:type-F conjugative transfer system pilin assembly protein TrbC
MLYVLRLLKLIFICFISAANASQSAGEEKYSSEIKQLTEIEMSSGLRKRMQSLTNTYNSSQFTDSIKRYQNDIEVLINQERLGEDEKGDDPDVKDRAILFISASIPIYVLRSYARQLHNIGGGTMVMNGFIGGAKKVTPTLKFIAGVINIDENCVGPSCVKYKVDIIIDPILFQHHSVKRVPAFTVYGSKTYTERCKGNSALESSNVVYGDASIRGLALELLAIDGRSTIRRFVNKAGYNN